MNPRLHFYLRDQLATEVQGENHWTLFNTSEKPQSKRRTTFGVLHSRLVTTDSQHSMTAALLATDAAGSVVQVQGSDEDAPQSYTAYGYLPNSESRHWLLGFNGEREDRASGTYLLGNGYRPYSAALHRFLSPDSLSPFGDGGRNAYAYCEGDPINRFDPSGHRAVRVVYSQPKFDPVRVRRPRPIQRQQNREVQPQPDRPANAPAATQNTMTAEQASSLLENLMTNHQQEQVLTNLLSRTLSTERRFQITANVVMIRSEIATIRGQLRPHLTGGQF